MRDFDEHDDVQYYPPVRCDVCGVESVEFRLEGGVPICSSCWASERELPPLDLPEPQRQELVGDRVLVCDACKERIEDEGVSFQDDKPYHAGCWVGCFGEG